MSADNTILILKLKDQFRVLHCQAVDNLWFTWAKMPVETPVSARVFEYFKDAHAIPATFVNMEAESIALERAKRLYSEVGYVEYGIQFLEIDKTFREIVEDALENIQEEISTVYSSDELTPEKKIMLGEELKTTLNNLQGWLAIHE